METKRAPRGWAARGSAIAIGLSRVALAAVLSLALAGCDATTDVPSPTASLGVAAQALEALAHGTRTERAAAADTLAELGAREAVPALIAALDDASWAVRWRAAAALGTLRDARAVEPLLSLAAVAPVAPAVSDADLDDAASAYRAAVAALGQIGDARAVPRLVAIALGDDPAAATPPAREALQAIGEPAIPAVREAIAGLTADAAADAVTLLASFGDPALDPLAAMLKDGRPAVRTAAASALADFGKAAVNPLLGVLSGTDHDLRGVAARSLGSIGDTAATPALVKLLSDSANTSAATWALAKIHAADGTPLVRYLGSKSTVGVYRALIRIGQSDTVSALVKALKSFGTKTMGEAYLNCGNPTLEQAAHDWADAHGYQVVSKPGVGDETWGGG